MCMDSVFGGRRKDDAHQPGMDTVTAIAEWSRVDLLRVTGLRIWPGRPNRGGCSVSSPRWVCPRCATRWSSRSPRPAPTGIGSAARGTAIREPLGEAAFPSLTAVPPDPAPGRPGEVTVAGRTVAVMVGSRPGGGPEYTAWLVCSWSTGFLPTEVDAALVGVLVDYATALVHPERTTGRMTNSSTARQGRVRAG